MEHVEALRQLADKYSVRSAQKLKQLSIKLGNNFTLKECQQALEKNVPAQTLGPPPRSLGHSAAEGPGSRLQADLQDFALNSHGRNNDEHRYALQVNDVFTRKAYTEPLKGKNSIQVDSAMRKILQEVPNQGRNAVVTTDAGGEFAGLDKVLPGDAVHRSKQSVNDIAVVDRSMQEIKKGLESKAQTNGQGWAHNLKEATSNYNFTPHSAVHGAPEDVGKENAQTFYVMQDNANNFMHNRALTISRQQAVQSAEAYREPVDNGGRSFKPAYGELHDFKKFGPGGGTVEDSRGNVALLKHVRPAAKGSGEPLAHITFQKRADKPKPSREPEAPKPEVPVEPERPRPNVQVGGPSASGINEPMEPERPHVQAGGSSASGINEPLRPRMSEAQLRRQDPVSVQIATYVAKTTAQQRQDAANKKAAALALREAAKNERDKKAAAKEFEKQNKQLARLVKKPIT